MNIQASWPNAPMFAAAPGTTTMQISGTRVRYLDPYARGFYEMRGLRDAAPMPLDTSAHVRWDLIAGVGGGAMIIALLAGILASR